MRERRYQPDGTDAEWAVVCPLLPVPGWIRGRGSRPGAELPFRILAESEYRLAHTKAAQAEHAGAR